MVVAVCVAAGPVIFLTAACPYGWTLWGLLILLGTIVYARMSASESFIMKQSRAGSRSTVFGIYYFSSMEGGGILTPVVGHLIDRFGFTAAFATAGAVLMAATLLCSFGLSERGK